MRWNTEARQGVSAFFFQAEDGIRDRDVTGVQTCALPIFTVNGPDGEDTRVAVAFIEVFLPLLQGIQVLPDRTVQMEQIGRASCRERVEVSGVGVAVKIKRSKEMCAVRCAARTAAGRI